MAMHGIINEHARGAAFSVPHEQAGKHTHTDTNTHSQTYADIAQAHMQTSTQAYGIYTHTLMHVWTHMHTQTEPDYFAYLLSKQSLVGSPRLTPALHQSIKPTLWEPVKPRYL